MYKEKANLELEETKEFQESSEVEETKETEEMEESAKTPYETEEVATEENEDILIDLTQVTSVEATPSARAYSGPTDISIVNTERSGRRMVIKKEFVDHIGSESIEIAFLDEKNLIITPEGAGITDKDA